MGKSKSELKRLLKPPLIEGDQYISPALGPNDPRQRRGPQREGVTGLRYEPTHFIVDADGRLRLRDGAVTTKIIEKNTRDSLGGGTVVIPAVTRTQPCFWRRRDDETSSNTTEFNSATGIETDIMGRLPTINQSTTEYVLWQMYMPSDGDVTAAWTLYMSCVSLGGNGGTWVFDVEVFALEIGYDIEGSGGIVSADATLQVTVTTSDPAIDGYYLGKFSATIPADTFTSDTVEVFYRVTINSAPVNAADTAFPGMWVDYQTEAVTITVT